MLSFAWRLGRNHPDDILASRLLFKDRTDCNSRVRDRSNTIHCVKCSVSLEEIEMVEGCTQRIQCFSSEIQVSLEPRSFLVLTGITFDDSNKITFEGGMPFRLGRFFL